MSPAQPGLSIVFRRQSLLLYSRALGLVTGVGVVAAVTWAKLPDSVIPAEPVPVSLSAVSDGRIEVRSGGPGPAVLTGELASGQPPLRGRFLLRNGLGRVAAIELVPDRDNGEATVEDLRRLGITLRVGSRPGPVLLSPGEARPVSISIGLRDVARPEARRRSDTVSIRLVPRESTHHEVGGTGGIGEAAS